jgi:hypothetical protein
MRESQSEWAFGQCAASETVTVCPPTVNVPVRAAPGLAATVSVTVPLSMPPGPEVMEIQDALLTAVHTHVGTVVTVTDVPMDPLAGRSMVVGLTL